MAQGFDDLRATLLKRTQPQPTGQQGAQQPSTFSGPTSQDGSYSAGPTGGGTTPLMGSPMGVQQPSPMNPSLLDSLGQAVSGAGGMKMGPKTGMSVPSWPGTPSPMGPGDIPIGIPNESARVPPREQRFETGQKMIDGYQNGWNPNPMLIRILEGR